MKNKKLLMRFLCALLSVLMLACMVPAVTVSADDGTGTVTEDTEIDYTNVAYDSAEARIAAMTKYFDNGEYSLYCDETLGVVAYKKNATGEILFTNPWDMTKESNTEDTVRNPLMSQIILEYEDSQKGGATLNSYEDAILKGQFAVTPIQNGVRVEYALGEISARILVPMRIERTSFEEKILKPLEENLTSFEYSKFWVYFSLKQQGGMGIATAYPVTEEKGIDIYVFNGDPENTKVLRELEAKILEYCPDYSFAQLDEDYELVEYEYEATSPAVFRMALEYTIDENGLSVCLPANGLRYDETAYRVTDLQILPYMGASYKGNPTRTVKTNTGSTGAGTATDAETEVVYFDNGTTYSGYSFLPDGSGALYELTQKAARVARVYGNDYALLSVTGTHTTPMRMPVFGQVLTATDKDGNKVSSGYMAIIEEGESLASIALNHGTNDYTSIIPSFITRQADTSKSSWTVYAARRYADDYKIRYIILSDDNKAKEAALDSYYECSWMGMACAYRDYLDAQDNGFERLTESDVSTSIPLYIETFGCMDTVKQILSVPVTVSVALTSFEDIETMYEYLLGESVTNVKFKLTGYANGGIYSEVPYKLKWEGSVGGKSGFKDLLEYAAAHPELGIFPDFDFAYTQSSDSSVNMKKYGARTVDNRYTSKRTYSVTQQTLVSHYQMVLSPATFSHFYEKLEKRYAKYSNAAISLSTMGSDLNSSFDEENVSLREDSKNYVMQALDYFTSKNYEVMVDGGNAYTWRYADYILDVPLTSNRYNNEYATVPFMGVVLHGYVEFASTPLNTEGNLTYAMLKAMESGAGIYFVLSYTNTELLKEDEILSQNYSVRYDIWQSRLVEIYKELNAVLADVQTKLIIGHEFLEDSVRIPDKDELLSDALEEAAKQAAAVQERIDNINLATTGISQVSTRLDGYQAMLTAQYAAIQAQRASDSVLMTAWNTYLADKSVANERAFMLALTTYVAQPMANLVAMRAAIDGLKDSATLNYQYLVDTGAEAWIIEDAAEALARINTTYDAICAQYGTKDATFVYAAEKFNDLTAYADVSVEDLLAVYAGALAGDGGQSKINVNLANVVATLAEKLEIKSEPVAEDLIATEETNTSYKYAVDNEVVLVTYGDYDANGNEVAYKSLILNFNDYAITTTVNGVVYNVNAYDYVVIMHTTNS